MLCDEATSALDPATTDSILDLLKKTNETFGVTILVITHEMSVIQKICHRVAVMENGQVIELDTVKSVFSQPQTSTAQRFVSTVINTLPSPSVIKDIQLHEDDTVYKLFIEPSQIKHTILNDLIQEINVKVNVIHAITANIQDETVGYLWLQVTGNPAQQSDVRSYFETHHIQYELSLIHI